MREVTKALENAPDIMEMSRGWGLLIAPGAGSGRTGSIQFAHCPKSGADSARGAVAALPADAAVPDRPSGVGADGLALADGRAGDAAMD